MCPRDIKTENLLRLFVLLFPLQFSFFLWIELRLFLLFLLALIFTSFVTHFYFSVNESEITSTKVLLSTLIPTFAFSV